jgi:2-keto-3-deoxy-L-rhamnonate aldolase RhmA
MPAHDPLTPLGRAIFREDGPSVCLGVHRFRGPHVMPVIAEGGADYALLDMEHTSFDLSEIDVMIATAHAHDLAVVVRPPDVTRAWIGRLVDIGADGILTPVIADAEAAAAAVRFAKYRPVGDRGDDGRLAAAGPANAISAAERINAGVVVIVGVETVNAVEQIDEICAIPGLDAVWIGNADLSLELGCPGDFTSEVYRATEGRVVEACRKHRVAYAVGIADSEATMREQIAMGCFTVSPEYETGLLREAISGYVQRVRDTSTTERMP